MRALIIVVVVLGTAAPAYAKDNGNKRKPVKWKDVGVLEVEPTTCEFLGKVDKDASSFLVFTGKGLREKVTKGLKKKVGKMGGNQLFVTDKMVVDGGASYEAKAFWCDPGVPLTTTPAPAKGPEATP